MSWKLSTGEDSGRGIRQYPSEPYHPLQLVASDCKRAINFVSCLLPVAANDRPARRTIVAPRDRRSIAAVLDRCCASLACLLLSAVIVVDLHCFAMVIANVVLHRWHFQERKVNAAVHRRFLNVTGTGGALQAKVHFRGDARVAPQLFLELRNCRPNADRQGASLRIPGLNVSALAVASSRVASSAERTELGLPAEQDAVIVDTISPSQLQAVGFAEPPLADGPATGRTVSIDEVVHGIGNVGALDFFVGQLVRVGPAPAPVRVIKRMLKQGFQNNVGAEPQVKPRRRRENLGVLGAP